MTIGFSKLFGAFIITAGAGLTLFSIFTFIRPSSVSRKREVALRTIAVLWNSNEHVRINDLAKLWRSEDGDNYSPEFKHAITTEFYAKLSSEKFMKGNAGEVIVVILTMLDDEGDCSSVVDTMKNDFEAKLEITTFDMLAKTNLLQHSINVADEMTRITGSGPAAVKGIIAALGHDLGKIPRFRDALYSLGDHCMISVAALNKIEAFNKLSFKAEIEEAVKVHHPPRIPKVQFSIDFRRADQEARKKELAGYRSEAFDQNLSQVDGDEGTQPTEKPIEERPVIIPKDPATEEIVQLAAAMSTFEDKVEDSHAAKTPNMGAQLSEVNLSWYDKEKIIEGLRPYVNILINGSIWRAFSMKDGIVYVQVELLWDCLYELGKVYEDSNVLLGKGDLSIKRNVLHSIVKRLRTDGAITESLIGEGYYGNHFILTMNNGNGQTREMKGYYVPFEASSFSATVSELEAIKRGVLKKIMKVTPQNQQEEEGSYDVF
ncbi:MAG: HD domain-containing protein [Nitrospinota bacterium]|nr:HD domain-containing protein [Nitrospinota bacterium]